MDLANVTTNAPMPMPDSSSTLNTTTDQRPRLLTMLHATKKSPQLNPCPPALQKVHFHSRVEEVLPALFDVGAAAVAKVKETSRAPIAVPKLEELGLGSNL